MSDEATKHDVLQRGAHSERVDRMAAILKEHQDLVYKQENVSKFFDKDTLIMARSLWGQIHDQMGSAIQEKYTRILEQFQVAEKLSQLDVLENMYQGSEAAWRLSGCPEEDSNVASGAVLRTTTIPEFEKMYEEVQGATSKLQDLMKEKQQEMTVLETQITNKTDQLSTGTDELSSATN